MYTENAVLSHSPQRDVNAVQAYLPQCIVMPFHTPLFGRVCLYKAISLIWQSPLYLHTHANTHTRGLRCLHIPNSLLSVRRPMGTHAILPQARPCRSAPSGFGQHRSSLAYGATRPALTNLYKGVRQKPCLNAHTRNGSQPRSSSRYHRYLTSRLTAQ